LRYFGLCAGEGKTTPAGVASVREKDGIDASWHCLLDTQIVLNLINTLSHELEDVRRTRLAFSVKWERSNNVSMRDKFVIVQLSYQQSREIHTQTRDGTIASM
jgi:hypothetical protein